MTEDLRPAWMKALRRLIATTPSPTPKDQVEPTFGTVRSLNPLRIALDSDPLTTLSYAPACLDYPTYVGQRVWVQTYGRQVVVVGVSKSAPDLPVGTGGVWTGPVGKDPAMPWMVAEGQLLLRTDFPELSALYGNTFAGSTTTHVALPDARGRTAVHLESGSSRFGTIGQHFGTKDVTLTVDQMPSHTHMSDRHNYQTREAWGSGKALMSVMDVNGDLPGINSGQPAGGGQSHNNIQPSLTLRYMVKVR